MNDSEEGSFPGDDFEVEISAIGPEDGHASSSIIEAPLQQGLSRRERARRLAFGSGALLVALLLILVSVPSLRSQAFSFFGGAASPTPGFSSAPFTPQPQPGQGWSLAGPSYASGIAFAPSAPETAYTCGALHRAGNQNQAVPLSVGVSYDYGHTWLTLSTPAIAVTCYLKINPTNAQDVVLMAIPCQQCASPQPSKLYRTFDGGKHWSDWSLPAPGPNQSADLLYTQWMWVGSTFFIAPYLAGDSGYVRLAASVDGRPFVWLKTKTLFAGAPADAGINSLYATSTTLYIEMGSRKSCPPTCSWFMQSRDKGASWSPFEPMFQGQPVFLLTTGADGRTLLGQTVHYDAPYSRIYRRSTDGGATWSALAPKPVELAARPIFEAPDGSIYAEFDKDAADPAITQSPSATVGIYALAPGAAAWRYVSPLPAGGWFIIAWDEGGHPSALWGPVDTNALVPGMERHQP